MDEVQNLVVKPLKLIIEIINTKNEVSPQEKFLPFQNLRTFKYF